MDTLGPIVFRSVYVIWDHSHKHLDYAGVKCPNKTGFTVKDFWIDLRALYNGPTFQAKLEIKIINWLAIH